MELYFSEAEMITFLSKKGFHIELVKGWSYRGSYVSRGGDYEDGYQKTEIYIAYDKSNKPNTLIQEGNVSRLEMEYGLKKIFEKQLRKTLLSL